MSGLSLSGAGLAQFTWLVLRRASSSLSHSTEHSHTNGFSVKSICCNSCHVTIASENDVNALLRMIRFRRLGSPINAPFSMVASCLLLLKFMVSRLRLSLNTPFFITDSWVALDTSIDRKLTSPLNAFGSIVTKAFCPTHRSSNRFRSDSCLVGMADSRLSVNTSLLSTVSPLKALALMLINAAPVSSSTDSRPSPAKQSSSSVVNAFRPMRISARFPRNLNAGVGTARSWLSSKYNTRSRVRPWNEAGSMRVMRLAPKSSSSSLGSAANSRSGRSSR